MLYLWSLQRTHRTNSPVSRVTLQLAVAMRIVHPLGVIWEAIHLQGLHFHRLIVPCQDQVVSGRSHWRISRCRNSNSNSSSSSSITHSTWNSRDHFTQQSWRETSTCMSLED